MEDPRRSAGQADVIGTGRRGEIAYQIVEEVACRRPERHDTVIEGSVPRAIHLLWKTIIGLLMQNGLLMSERWRKESTHQTVEVEVGASRRPRITRLALSIGTDVGPGTFVMFCQAGQRC